MGACLPSPFSVPLSLALTLRSYQSSHPGGIPGGWGKEISLLIAQRGLGDRETSRTGGWGQRGPRNTGQVVMLPKALGWPRSLFGLFHTLQWTNPKGFFLANPTTVAPKSEYTVLTVYCRNASVPTHENSISALWSVLCSIEWTLDHQARQFKQRDFGCIDNNLGHNPIPLQRIICIISPASKETMGRDHEVRSYHFSKKKENLFEKKKSEKHWHVNNGEKAMKIYCCLGSPWQLHQFHSCAQFYSCSSLNVKHLPYL